MPTQDRIRGDDARDLRQDPPAEFVTAHSESTTLGVRQAKRPRAQVFSEDPILLPEIVDQIVLVTVHPASEREDEELQRRRHSLRLLGRLDQHRPSLGRFFAPYGIIVSYETIRPWCGKFGPDYARRLKRRQGRLGDTWFLDEVFVAITGQRQYLWRAVDQDGDLIDLLVQPRRDGRAARRFFRKLLKSQRQEPCRLVTDKLGSYRVAHRDVMVRRTIVRDKSEVPR